MATTTSSRQCAACTADGRRCRAWQCRGSALLERLPAALRRRVESTILRQAFVSNCAGAEASDCCALCSVHFARAVVQFLVLAEVKHHKQVALMQTLAIGRADEYNLSQQVRTWEAMLDEV